MRTQQKVKYMGTQRFEIEQLNQDEGLTVTFALKQSGS